MAHGYGEVDTLAGAPSSSRGSASASGAGPRPLPTTRKQVRLLGPQERPYEAAGVACGLRLPPWSGIGLDPWYFQDYLFWCGV